MCKEEPMSACLACGPEGCGGGGREVGVRAKGGADVSDREAGEMLFADDDDAFWTSLIPRPPLPSAAVATTVAFPTSPGGARGCTTSSLSVRRWYCVGRDTGTSLGSLETGTGSCAEGSRLCMLEGTRASESRRERGGVVYAEEE